ncbi:uncharacterized protein THITE_2052648 [Thermothielavioides terrestris NRRL 8126]|uniref:Uncharacterized protein n=1 Tax=Thermothielavioides terrestris (strain ATCC 38088 / NRRL 8126) TaxID=578455 RepID=G2RBQ3_THETT|nr:uncharacterized protein THITE_2052648 [Thermothielavioides terrestris NRRL 8126]AEO69224.1 hypothetical protein THITE_2052648 [Thermothielavioides terrestris NRRL 8126]
MASRPRTSVALVVVVVVAAACCRADNVGDNELWALIRANRNNATALQTMDAPPWVSTAEFRGTMDILQTCILTLFACVYTALHLDVPARTNFLSLLARKTKWVFTTLFAPEMFDFDLRYAFFAVMGGVRIVPAEVEKFLGAKEKQQYARRPLRLTPDGVIELARRDFWIYISRERIDSKSKANTLQKALVLLQVSYSAITCVARRVYGLPLSLLEIHTMVHVISAVLLYALWFEVRSDHPEPKNTLAAELVYHKDWDNTIGAMIQRSTYVLECYDVAVRKVSQQAIPDNTNPADQFSSSSSVPGPGGIHLGHWHFSLRRSDSEPMQLSSQTVARWKAMATELDKFCRERRDWDTKLTSGEMIPLREVMWEFPNALEKTKDLGSLTDTLLEAASPGPLMPLGIALPGIYGGVHLSAWHFEFPTFAEHLLWKIMCFIIIGAVPTLLATLVGLLATSSNDDGEWQWVCYASVAVIVVICSGCARIYIVLESFISLRRVPIGVYYTPAWLQMIPHA